MHIDLFKPEALCHFDQTVHMRHVAVYAAGGEQSHEVQRGALVLCILHRGFQRGILKEIAVLNGFCDLDKLLIDNSAGAHIGMTDLGIAHLTVRQTDIESGSADDIVRVLRKIAVEIRGFRCLDRVAVVARIDSEAVHDQQCNRCFAHNYISPFFSGSPCGGYQIGQAVRLLAKRQCPFEIPSSA